MDLDENENLLEPSTYDECIAKWLCYYRNFRCPGMTFDCKLMELDMFENYKSFF